MTIFDLLFIAVFLSACAALLIALVQAITGKFRSAARTMLALACGLGVYLAVLCIVSLSSAQRVKNLGEADCADDWCVTPEQAHRSGDNLAVDFRVWSRAKRVTQREYGLAPYLVDDRNRRCDIVESDGPAFDRPIGPGESFLTTRRYRIEPDARTIDLIIRGSQPFTPAWFVIGDQASLLHPRTVVRLKPSPGPV